MENAKDQQQVIIKRLKNVLKGQVMIVQEDTFLSVKDKNIQLQVILNLAEFLDNYDRNISIWKGDSKTEEQMKQMKQIEQEDMGYR